jgi:hypothetical protein
MLPLIFFLCSSVRVLNGSSARSTSATQPKRKTFSSFFSRTEKEIQLAAPFAVAELTVTVAQQRLFSGYEVMGGHGSSL